MPNLNEIATFRDELKNIAQEDKVTAGWGERVYDELPPPDPAEVPDIDLDALLSSVPTGDSAGGAAPSEPSRDTAPDAARTQQEPLSRADTAGAAAPQSSDASSGSKAAEKTGPSARNDILEDDGEAYPVDDSGMPETPDIDNFFSSFNFDDLPGGDSDSTFPVDSERDPLDDAESGSGSDTAADDPAPLSGDPGLSDDFSLDSDSEPVGDSFESLIPDIGDFDVPDSGTSQEDADDLDGFSLGDDFSLGNDEQSGSGASQNFDDMLSSLDFDSEPDDWANPDSLGAAPLSDDDSHGAASDDADFSMDDLDVPNIDLSSFDSLGDDDTSDGFSVLDDVISQDEMPDADADTAALHDWQDAADEDAFGSESGAFDTPAPQSGDARQPEPFGNFGDLNDLKELSLFSEDRDDPSAAVVEEETPADDASGGDTDISAFDFDAADDSAAPADHTDELPASQEGTGIPDMALSARPSEDFFAQPPETEDTNQSGFSLEENPLDTDITEVSDDQFNLPDNFKDFSADAHSRMFDSVIEKSTGAGEKDDPLSISDDDYFAFLNRLESFPLNVQLAIQNYIANGDDSSENKMEFIRFVLATDSLKKIVNKLGKLINQTIQIPRGFQRKSIEEYEREKKTLKYWILHRFLPVAVMSAIALILVFCISVLSWQFIYKPVTSESLYKTGYAYLQNEQYETAVEKFNKAGEYQRKKRWYFAYARAFRTKKQFTAAEKMYTRLIYDFNYDKQGGLEYADMLSTDLRNYEKAETILRRSLLDQHVNDKDGLLALGDVYMNWADEDPEKYDTAVKIYSRLIELYGENDTFLIRMMRYFIRTDNLAEVLNLKEHFSSRLSKIGAPDLTELSGYLLEKRYNPKPLDSEQLRMRIDDVRLLLEKAVQADKTVPEAYYNLGRFFIYNNKLDGAIENLTEAINRFKTAAPMTARRTMQYVDAMRLLGEQLVMQKKYLDAQTLYADALNIYRDYTAFKPLPPNRNIGKLYADYGDIDYFISYNFDSALDSYQHAVKELYNTPSVNYRIGYIQYQQENYQQAIEAISRAYAGKANDKNVMYGFGNAFFKRGDYFAALALYEQLLGALNIQRSRKDYAMSSTRPDDAAFMEQYMHVVNNLGATLSRLAERTGDSQKHGRALALYAEATRAWDALTRNPQTMIRAKSVGLAYLNIQNMLNSKSPYDAEIYTDIPMILENEKALEQKEAK